MSTVVTFPSGPSSGRVHGAYFRILACSHLLGLERASGTRGNVLYVHVRPMHDEEQRLPAEYVCQDELANRILMLVSVAHGDDALREILFGTAMSDACTLRYAGGSVPYAQICSSPIPVARPRAI